VVFPVLCNAIIRNTIYSGNLNLRAIVCFIFHWSPLCSDLVVHIAFYYSSRITNLVHFNPVILRKYSTFKLEGADGTSSSISTGWTVVIPQSHQSKSSFETNSLNSMISGLIQSQPWPGYRLSLFREGFFFFFGLSDRWADSGTRSSGDIHRYVPRRREPILEDLES